MNIEKLELNYITMLGIRSIECIIIILYESQNDFTIFLRTYNVYKNMIVHFYNMIILKYIAIKENIIKV